MSGEGLLWAIMGLIALACSIAVCATADRPRKPRGENFLDQYPPRWWWPVVNIYGGPGHQEVYMRRYVLSPKTRWGQLYIHVFYRPDQDRDPHDHPFPFWTFPLNQGYVEEVYNTHLHCFTVVRVPARRLSHRPARHTHRVTRTDTGRWPLITLVWRGNTERVWGFWCHSASPSPMVRQRFWHSWKDYTLGSGNGTAPNIANQPGTDELCPGTSKRVVIGGTSDPNDPSHYSIAGYDLKMFERDRADAERNGVFLSIDEAPSCGVENKTAA